MSLIKSSKYGMNSADENSDGRMTRKEFGRFYNDIFQLELV